MEFITTSRGAHSLIHEGYRYVEIMKQEQVDTEVSIAQLATGAQAQEEQRKVS